MNDAFRKQILASPQLPTLPAVALQVLELAQRDEVDVSRIAATITQDPALTARVLKTVNSSFYARRNPIASVTQALVMLGLQSVKTLVLGFSLVPTLVGGRGEAGGVDRDRYWRRSLHAATAARSLARRAGLATQQEEAFLGALLADIGVLVLERTLGPAYHAVHAVASASHVQLAAAERTALGATHAEVAEVLLGAWRLPPILIEPIAYHHEPSRCSSPALAQFAAIVGLAGRIGDVFVDAAPASAVRDVRAGCETTLRLSAADADAVLAEVAAGAREIAPLFDIRLGHELDLAAVLRRANDALVQLTLESQAHAVELERQNEALRVRAHVDRLTGLANRMRLDEFAAEQFAPETAGRPLSIVMMDVDHFKTVNDRFGHDVGDAVLSHVGAILARVARPGDLAARYGGEEFTLVLPNTTRAEATAIAERVRQLVESQPTAGANRPVAVTLSLGVATREPGTPFAEPRHLFKAADLAMYKAKHSGRNNVKVFAIAPAAFRAA